MKRALLVLLLCTACTPLQLRFNKPEGPPEYVQGFDDGCESGIAVDGDFWLKITHHLKKDPNYMNDQNYTRGWNEGFSFCRGYYGSLKKHGPVGDSGWFGY
jgi:hypothetical protein